MASKHTTDATTGLPIGREVASHAAKRPERVTLGGRYVDLVPLDAGHADDIYAAQAGPKAPHLWLYMPDGPFDSVETFRTFIATKAQSQDPLFFAIVDKPSGKAVGYCTLMRIDQASRVIETGNILYTPTLQRKPGATEAMYLLARYVFDELGYRRYEWKCNDLNAPSRRAAMRLGMTFEGIFRQAVIVKGRNRDTAWFSMLDREWPERKKRFEKWLAPENFDADGKQIVSLSSLNGAGSS